MESSAQATILSTKYTIVRKLGEGYSADVFLIKDNLNGSLFALKTYKKPRDYTVECSIMSELAGKSGSLVNLLAKFDQCTYQATPEEPLVTRPAIIMEYAENGDLATIIEAAGSLPEKLARYYFHALISGLEAIHNSKIANRDIKPENMLIDSSFNLKIADFGFAKKIQYVDGVPQPFTDVVGTKRHMSPELLNEEEYFGDVVDIFSAGVALFRMVVGFPPFMEANYEDEFYRAIANGDYELYWDRYTQAYYEQTDEEIVFSKDFKDLVNRMLAAEQQDRISLKGIKEHPWFNGSLPSSEEVVSEMKKRIDE